MTAGHYELRMDMVQLGNDFFEAFGSVPIAHHFSVMARSETETYWDKAVRSCSNLWTVTQGIHRHGDDTFPLFAVRADGPYLYDMDGREYLDYIMGWGTATLGYNRPEIQEAIKPWLGSGPTLPFPHPLQIETAEMLQQFLPCADRVVFGKNASDVLEAAVRTARVYTNRDHVLCCGYHGFHDWYVASIPSVKGIPNALRQLIHLVPFGDIQAIQTLLDEWGNQTACIVMEPCSMAYPPDGYLQTVRELANQHNIVLIFDEVMSAFRLANGGAQERYHIEPDMVVVGKGIANGMPLAALGGVTPLIDAIFEVGYGPTFHSEIYSLAAAKAALEIYHNEPVCQYLNQVGEQLKLGITSSAAEWNIPLTLEGILPRQVFIFQARDGYSAAQIRTYFLQELLKRNTVCGGTLLPSYTHSQEHIAITIDNITEIWIGLNDKLKNGDLEKYIQIPLNVLYLGEKENEKIV